MNVKSIDYFSQLYLKTLIFIFTILSIFTFCYFFTIKLRQQFMKNLYLIHSLFAIPIYYILNFGKLPKNARLLTANIKQDLKFFESLQKVRKQFFGETNPESPFQHQDEIKKKPREKGLLEKQ